MMNFFHSGMTSAPVLSGTAGSLISVLDACLVDGFGVKPATITVLDGVATATVAAPHTFVVGLRALVSGATPVGLNGTSVVLEVSTTTVKFATTASNGAASGSITIKVAPLGWQKAHTGTNKAAYKAMTPDASGFKLRVDDAGAQHARVVGYEVMADVDTGDRLFPTTTQIAGGFYWPKSSAVDASTRSWFIVGDERCFYFCPAPSTSYPDGFSVFAFGEPEAFKSGDPFSCMLTGVAHTSFSDYSGCISYSRSNNLPSIVEGRIIARSHSGVGGARPAAVFGANALRDNSTVSGGSTYGMGSYPNPADNGLYLGKVMVFAEGSYRASMPGFLHVLHSAVNAFPRFEIIDGTGNMAGRKVMMLPVSKNGSYTGVVAFDTTGPWR